MTGSKKWMYLSFSLMGIIASGVLVPTAMAASPTLTDIFNKLAGVDAKITAIKATTDTNLDDKVSTKASQRSVNNVLGNVTAIRTATDSNLDAKVTTRASQASVDSMHQKTLKFQHEFNPDAGSRVPIQSWGLLAPSSGKTFAGHISFSSDIDVLGNAVTLICNTGPSSAVRIFDNQSVNRNFNADFACESIVLEVLDEEPDSGPIFVEGLLQYVESSDITETS